MIRTEAIEDPKRLAEISVPWDELAVESRKPYCAPGWMLAWLEAMAPPQGRCGSIAVWDGDELIGVLPAWRSTLRGGVARIEPLAAPVSLRTEPLSRAGRETEVAGAIGSALSEGSERSDLFRWTGIPASSPWPGLLAGVLPGGAVSLRGLSMPAPYVDLGGNDASSWMDSKSKNFREQMRRNRRRLEKAGATLRLSDAASLESDVASLVSLHLARWSQRGGSSVVSSGVDRMLVRAGSILGPERFRLHCIDIDGTVISAHLFVAAGGEVSYWLGGFDETWSREQPAMQSLWHALEISWSRGDKRVDLGGGGQPYKYRLADDDEEVVWMVTIPRGGAFARSLALSVPEWGKRALLRRVPDPIKTRVKQVLRPSNS